MTFALPLVSVLLPVYNVENYVERCVRSLQNQTYSNIEIIVVDDCSSDQSGAIVEKLASQDPHITVIRHKQNMGLSSARNTGLDHAHGEFITFVDSDDWVEPDYISYLYDLSLRTGADIAVARNFFTSRYREQIRNDEISVITPEDMLCDIFYNRIHVGVWNRLYKASCIGDCRFRIDARTGEGMQFNAQVVPNANRIGMGLRRVYTYNVDNDSSATKRPNVDKQAYGSISTMEIIKKTLKQRSKRLDEAVEYQCFTTSLYALTHLLRANAQREHNDFYRRLVRYIRRTAPKTLHMEIDAKQKIKSIMAWISPYWTVKVAIFWRYTLGKKQRV